MSLFETIPIEHSQVKSVLQAKWNVKFGSLIKASQNHTFKAENESGEPVIVRVTPDPKNEHRERIELEVAFLNYLTTTYPKLNVCPVIPALNGERFIVDSDLVYVVFKYAGGAPVVWGEFKWLADRDLVEAWGKWLANFHIASKQYSKTHPEQAAKVRRWTQLHDKIMEGVKVDPEDAKLEKDPEQFGILHGDLNTSNFFYDATEKALHVFDWDQVQIGWHLYDLAQGIFGVVMLAGTGSPGGDGKSIDPAEIEKFTGWVVTGYESVPGTAKVDRVALKRMISLKKLFYYRFCSRATKELEGNTVLKGMYDFCKFVTTWLEKEGFGPDRHDFY